MGDDPRVTTPTLRITAAGTCLIALCVACGLSLPEGIEGPGFELSVGLYGPCLADDVNGDGVGELAVLLYNDFAQQRAALLDGATGLVIWEGAPYPGSDVAALCVGGSHFAVVPPGGAFRLDLYPVAAHESVQQLALDDQPFRYGTAPGCFRLSTANRHESGYLLGATVTPGECSAEATRVAHDHINTADSSDELPMTSSHEGITYELSFREEGTELVHVARRGGWSRELALLATDIGSRAGMLAVPGGVVVVGQPHPEVEDTGVVLFLSADDGSERARATFMDQNNVGVGALVFNGRHAVVKLGNTVRAYDPASGAEVWAVGHSNRPGTSAGRHR